MTTQTTKKINPFRLIEVILMMLASSLLTALVGFILIQIYVVMPFKKAAVDRGFAIWEVTDNATGITKFTWNEMAQGLHKPNPDILAENEKPLPDVK